MTNSSIRKARAVLYSGALIALSLSNLGLLVTACGKEPERPDPPDSTTSSSGSGGRNAGMGGNDGESGGTGDGDSTSDGGGDGDTGDTPSAGGTSGVCLGFDCGVGQCDASAGFAQCVCPDGFSGTPCADINECLETPGPCPNGACVNSLGSYYCECLPGQVAQGEVCAEVSDCGQKPCDEQADCTELDGAAGGYSCSCKNGYFGTGWDCTNPDPCASDPCGSGACVATSAGAVCQCPLGLAGQDDCDQSCTLLDLVDPVLRNAAANQLGQYTNPDTIDPSLDLVGRTELYVSQGGTKTLDGLECWSNLRSLIITEGDLGSGEDTTPLQAISQLNQLTHLELRCADLADLSPLSNHPSLTSLSISMENCPAGTHSPPDLAPLATIPKLEVLDVSGLELTDLDALAGTRTLRTVFASSNSLSSVSGLSGNGLLRELSLDRNQLSTLSELDDLKNLVKIEVRDNPLTDADFIAAHPALQTVSASGGTIASVPSLQNNVGLRYLDLKDNELTSLAGLVEAPDLAILDVADNRLTTLAPIAATSFSGVLGAAGNAFDCEELAPMFQDLRDQGVILFTDCD